MKALKKAIMGLVIFTICFTSVRLAGQTTAKAAGGELDKIVFDGDSTYDWSHFYSIEGKEASISDLKITVLDKSGNTVPSDAYTVQVYATWWDDAAGKDMRQEVSAPYKIVVTPGGSDGFCEFIAKAAAADGSGYSGEIEATFHIMDKHCLAWICAETTIEGARKDGWRMCDRFFIDIEKFKAPVVIANDGTRLVEGRDYRIIYYTRADLDLDSFDTPRETVLEGVEKLTGLPTQPGGYVCKMEGISPYYGETEFLLDVEGELPDKPEDKDVKAGEEEVKPEDKDVKAGEEDTGSTEKDTKTGTEPPAVKTKKISKGKKAFTLKWEPQTEEVSGSKIAGYQIQYCTDKEFKKDAKTVKVKGSSKAKKKVSKLESGKVYYVRIRTYMKVGKKTVCSDWSEPIKVKTK